MIVIITPNAEHFTFIGNWLIQKDEVAIQITGNDLKLVLKESIL